MFIISRIYLWKYVKKRFKQPITIPEKRLFLGNLKNIFQAFQVHLRSSTLKQTCWSLGWQKTLSFPRAHGGSTWKMMVWFPYSVCRLFYIPLNLAELLCRSNAGFEPNGSSKCHGEGSNFSFSKREKEREREKESKKERKGGIKNVLFPVWWFLKLLL